MKKNNFLAAYGLAFVLLLANVFTVMGSPKGKKVTILTPYMSSVTTNQMANYLSDRLEDAGVIVTIVDTKGDMAQFASRIEDTVSAMVDAIVIISVDPSQVETQLESAFEANIPVFGVDSGFIEGMAVNATSDNYAMGKLIGEYLVNNLISGEGKIITLTHRPHPGVVKRCEAMDDLLKDNGEIELITEQHVEVPNPIENARKIVENLLLANSEKGSISAIWAAWDEPAIGAAQACLDAGRDEIVITGVDGNSQALQMIADGTDLKATVAQDFEGMAELISASIIQMFDDETIEPGEIYAPAKLITIKNVADYLKE